MPDIVFLGDDFTGASDSLASYARRGMAARLILSDETAAGNLDVLGIATDLRSLSPEHALKEIDSIWPRIAAATPTVLHYKVCSTFDSGPETGSIGAATRALAERFKPDIVAAIGGQPSLGRYCAFGNLFARGPDGTVHRIDRHPVMAQHPVTPMTEADLARHLALQGLNGLQKITAVDLGDPDSTLEKLRAGPVLFDVMHPEDQTAIADLLRRAGGRQLLIGASSIAEILSPGPVCEASPERAEAPSSPNLLLFAGSRSSTSKAQVDAARKYTRLALTRAELSSGSVAGKAAGMLREGKPVLIHLLPDEDYGLTPGALADACAEVIEAVLEKADAGYLGLAGGDTSSRICNRLGFDALSFERVIGSGVCICTGTHVLSTRNNMRVMLKGGQMGGPDLFDDFAAYAGK